MILSASSKTFFLGEYGVLKSSPSLVLCTDPQFQLDMESPLNVTGPIFDYVNDQKASLNGKFLDPWEGSGGFGASSAQFALFFKSFHPDFKIQKNEVSILLNEYRRYFWNCEGLAPSGHDVIAQLMGPGLHFVDPEKGVFETIDSELSGYDFIVIKTLKKIATHQHLNELQVMNIDLREIVIQAKEGLENNNLLQVVSAIEEQNRILMENHLICESTLSLRSDIEKKPGVIVTKGCGAMGADTVLVVCEKESTENLIKNFNSFVIWRGKI